MLHKRNHQTVAAPPVAGGLPAARIVEAPPIIQESVRYDRVTEVQPVIHRQVDQVHVRHIEKHIMSESAPSMGGSYEHPPLVQEHVNHRYVTEVHPVYHAPPVQYEESVRTISGPLQPMQQGAFQQGAFLQQQQQQTFAAPAMTQQVAYGIPQQQSVAATGFAPAAAAAPGYTSAAPAVAAKTPGRHHHIFHRPTNADGRYL